MTCEMLVLFPLEYTRNRIVGSSYSYVCNLLRRASSLFSALLLIYIPTSSVQGFLLLEHSQRMKLYEESSECLGENSKKTR